VEIPGFRLGRQIAETELCSVHNAIDLATSKTVSVRIFHSRLTQHPGFCRGFGHFAASVSGQRVGAMVSLLSHGADANACYAVTDYFPCLPLLHTQPAQIPPKAVLQGGIEIAATLELLHRQKLVHGALRPGNLFFNDRLKLTLGLGINRPEGEGARPLPVDSANAALYLPPEGGDGPAADWYALGVCLHDLLIGRPPFDAQDIKLQLLEKRRMLPERSDGTESNLLPLLQALLHPDPKRRIRSLSAFAEQAERVGFRLMVPPYAAAGPPQPARGTGETPVVSPSAAPQPAGGPKPESAPVSEITEPVNRRRTWILGASALALLALGSVLFWPASEAPDSAPQARPVQPPLPTREHAPEPVTAAAPVQAESSGLPPSETTGVPPAPEELPEDEQRYLEARSLFAEGKPGKALMVVNEALRINPHNADALALRQSITNELEIRSILKRAEQQLMEGRLADPPGNNALESYRSLARLLPKGDPRLQRGLARVANRYLDLSRKALAQNRVDDALQLADSGARLFPSFTPLQALRENIRRQLEEQRISAQRRQQEDRKLEQIRRIEQARRQQAAQRRSQMERFERALKPGASTESIAEASAAYAELEKLRTDDTELQTLRKKLAEARIALSEQQMKRGDFDSANRTLQQGLELGDDSGLLQRQMARLQQAIERHRQQQRADTLLAEAKVLIDTRNASANDLARADRLINEAAPLVTDDGTIVTIKQQLLEASNRLARAAIDADRLDEAEGYIRQGLSVSAADPRLLQRQQELDQARQRQKRRAVPVIGTF